MPASLAIFVSHNGKTLQLSCSATTRVEAVQQALVALTGVPLADQIVMCEGARLDPRKPLSAYGLPVDEQDQPHDVFLYNRALLKPGAAVPAEETAPTFTLQVPAQPSTREQPHALDQASSPLLRALPEYQRQFQCHVGQAKAYADVTQLRYAACAQLVSEQEVQALSIDAARSNVEAHFSYICGAFESFMQRYLRQHAIHADVLASFDEDLHFLAATEVHPALRREACQRLLDLVNAEHLRAVRDGCMRSHRHFATKVAELESLFTLLKGDVEALFMQAPSVDLEALTERLAEMHARVSEQASIVQALSSDFAKVKQIVEQTTAQLGASTSTSITMQLPDTCQMLETMHESHVSHLLPRATSCDQELENFVAHCVGCKNALTKDAVHQLQRIASQQSRIREMKDKLAVFGEALGKQEAAVGELLALRRVPAAYKQCLAECVRRAAFSEKYAQSAAKLAESMGRFREKEVAMRDAFRRHVERYIPAAVLERMGLVEQPPHCEVNVPTSTGEQLMHVTVDEMRRFQLPWDASSFGEAGPSSRVAAAQEQPQGAEQGVGAEARGLMDDPITTLQMENARLRADLASQVAAGCIRTAQLAEVSSQIQASQQLQQPPRAGAGGDAAAAAGREPEQPQAGSGLPAGAAQAFERALGAKDGLVAELQAQLGTSQAQVATYEQRILSLEEQLASMAASAREERMAGSPLTRDAETALASSAVPEEEASPAADASAPSQVPGAVPPASPTGAGSALLPAGSAHSDAAASPIAGIFSSAATGAWSSGGSSPAHSAHADVAGHASAACSPGRSGHAVFAGQAGAQLAGSPAQSAGEAPSSSAVHEQPGAGGLSSASQVAAGSSSLAGAWASSATGEALSYSSSLHTALPGGPPGASASCLPLQSSQRGECVVEGNAVREQQPWVPPHAECPAGQPRPSSPTAPPAAVSGASELPAVPPVQQQKLLAEPPAVQPELGEQLEIVQELGAGSQPVRAAAEQPVVPESAQQHGGAAADGEPEAVALPDLPAAATVRAGSQEEAPATGGGMEAGGTVEPEEDTMLSAPADTADAVTAPFGAAAVAQEAEQQGGALVVAEPAVVDEGSDVEGIEAVSNDEGDEDYGTPSSSPPRFADPQD